MPETSRPVRRIAVAATAAAVLVAGAVTTATAGDRSGDLVSDYDRSVRQAAEAAAEVKAEARPHSHSDPSTKNALSRAGETTRNAQDPTSAVEKAANAAAVAAGRGTPEPTLTTTPATRPRATHPATRYAMANGCYTLVDGGEPLFFKPTRLGDYLLYDAERQFVGGRRPEGGRARRRHDLDRHQGRPPHPAHQRRGVPRGRRPQPLPADPDHRLRGLPGVAGQHHRRPVRRGLAVPGGAGVRRRAHPRHGLRVPRGRRPLRQAVGPVRCAVRARGLPRPRDRQQPARGDPLRRALPRPRRLADLRRLARARLADPRGHLLQVDGAVVARRAAALRQPARREQPALHALPVRTGWQPAEELLRRHGLGPAPGQADAPVPELHRRAVGRPGQGLVPDREEPVAGTPRHQRRQDGDRHGHRDQRALRLHLQGRTGR